MKRKQFAKACAVLACLALLAALCLSGVLDKQQIWPNVPIEYMQGKQEYSLAAGDSYGMITAGPYTELPAGTYRLKWQIEGDGVNAVRLLNSNDVAIEPAVFETTPGAFEGEGVFEITEGVHNFSIGVEFCDGSYIRVHNMRLYSPVYKDNYFTLFALLGLSALLFFMHRRGRLPLSRREMLIPLALAVILVSVPALREETIFNTDAVFHANRLRNLADSLAAGQFPARVGGHTYNGYGAATSVFYPDLLLYPLAAMLLMGASMGYVLNVWLLAINALSALCMYIAGKRIFRSRDAGVYAAMLYVCFGFRLDRLYGSFMVGQMLAMAVLPVFLLGLWEVFFGDARRWPVLALGATLVFQSHMLTTVLCAGVAALALVVYGKKLWRERRVGAVALSVLFAGLINLNVLVPLVTTYLSGVTTSVVTYGFVDLTHGVHTLLGTDKELGLAVMLGLAALLCCSREAVTRTARADVLRMGLLSAVCLWMATDLFPWSYVFALTGGVLEILQFSWRFLVIAAPCLALCGGLGYACLLDKKGAKGYLAVLAIALVCVYPITERAMDADTMEFGLDASPYILHPEYQFEGTDLEATRSRAVLTQGDVLISEYVKKGTRIAAQLQAKSDAVVTLPLFGFDGYAAELDGQRIAWTRGENNRLAVSLPAGTQGELRIRYEGKLLWRVADVVSLLSAAILCAMGVRGCRAIRRNGGKGL